MKPNFQPLLRSKPKPRLSNDRVVEGLALKKLQESDSYHSSIIMSQRNTSMVNSINSFSLRSDATVSRNSSHTSFRTSRVSSNQESFSRKSIQAQRQSGQKQRPEAVLSNNHPYSSSKPALPKILPESPVLTVEEILKKYIDTNFVQSLMGFVTRDWQEQEVSLLKQKRFQALRNLITQKTNLLNQLVEEFMSMEYQNFRLEQRKTMISLLFKQQSRVLNEYESLFSEILTKIPEDKIVKQENQIEEISSKLCQIFDPKYISSTQKMKERAELFMEGYSTQKNELLASIVTKLKGSLDFISQMERYLTVYQKQVVKLRNQLSASQIQKNNIHNLLKKKVNFTPVQMDYDRIHEIKEDSKKQFFQDLETNFIRFHENQHKKNNKVITKQDQQNELIRRQLEESKEDLAKLKQQIYDMVHSIPKKVDASTQLYQISESKPAMLSASSSFLNSFLANVSTPFSFNEKVTGSLINLLSIDKVLYDYEIIRHKHKLQSFSEFMLEWFLIRTGSKRSAQIFTKNFMYSVKQLKGRHKRFSIFCKICGFNGFRKKSVQEDLEYIFFQTQRAWYYLIKIALLYRRKINDNPTGYHLFPPLPCESIFKLPLRKVYELIEEFLIDEGVDIPSDLTNRIDYYAINEISKFKSHDENYQKEQLEQIHILREINFDLIAGFIIEYIGRERCIVIQKLLRTLSIKQKQIGDVLGYSEFQGIYRKYYKERRAKIQHIYSKICVMNQHDLMDIENSEPIIRAILEDESGMRNIFDEMDSLKSLILTEKSNIMKSEKIAANPNSFENFRDRYYYQFYDFYNTTTFLQEIYRIVRSLIKKKLRHFIKDETKLEQMVADKKPLEIVDTPAKKKKSEGSDSDEDEYSGEEQEVPVTEHKEEQANVRRQYLQGKVEEWGKIIVRIPHFVQKILTIDQIIVHNMRRKEMIEASEFAWRTLRQLLISISKD